ncbi:hypothetical protein KA005_14215, partial [bacterium]|nr:hypothetical protein [bacterium]
MNQKHSPIPACLRPDVPGAKVVSTEINTDKASIVEQQLYSNRHVVIFGSLEDGTTAYFSAYCVRNSIPIIVFDLRSKQDISSACRLVQQQLKNAEFKAFFRYAESDVAGIQKGIAFLSDMLKRANGRVVNRPNDKALNISKPMQISNIVHNHNGSVDIPRTLINNRNVCDLTCEVIIKSITSIRSSVVKKQDIDFGAHGSRLSCPVMQQELIDGVNYRAHVINGSVISCRIETDFLDYRVDHQPNINEEALPVGIMEWCKYITDVENLD